MSSVVPFKISSSEEILTTFEQILSELRSKHPKLFLSQQTNVDIKTAFVEAVANAIKHARELDHHKSVEGQLYLDNKAIGFDVYDHGQGYVIDSVPIPDLSDLQASGRGVFMMKQLGDKVGYKTGKTKNTLSFRRYLIGRNESAQELDLLYELSEAIISHASLDEVYQIILGRALQLFHVERASILIYDENLKRLKVVASRGMADNVQKNIRVRSGEGVSGYVYQHGRPLLIEDIESNKRGIEKKDHYKTGSFISAPMICSPLRLEEKSIGVINLTDRVDGKKFSKKDLKLLSTIANQAMACLYIRGLVDEAKKAEILKKEMEQVRLIQDSYLPKKAPVIQGFDISGRCEMAQSVGGDYFDYFLVDTNLYLVAADVSGHNMSSAVTMVNFRSQLKAYLNQQSDPAQILTMLNRSLNEDLQKFEQFVSCILVKIDTNTGKFELANAGHYPPLFYSMHIPVMESGLVMGIEPDETYTNVCGQLDEQDGMLLFTDGVIESMDKDERVFGLDKLRTILSDNLKLDSRDLVNHIIESVLQFRKTQGNLDDITVVGVKRTR